MYTRRNNRRNRSQNAKLVFFQSPHLASAIRGATVKLDCWPHYRVFQHKLIFTISNEATRMDDRQLSLPG